MGSTEACINKRPPNRKSIKLRIEEGINNKPSIKITVSSDTLVEKKLHNNTNHISSSPSSTEITNAGLDKYNGVGEVGGETDSSSVQQQQQQQQQQKPALIQIVGDCCKACNSNGEERDEKLPPSTPPPNGALCSCENEEGDKNRTRIALDDFTVLEFPNCIDFGIKDFLCCRDEIDLDVSSDTDASFLEATPPHRFSDSELESQIEAMSITLDTTLNPFPCRGNSYVIRSLKGSIPDDDDVEEEEEETTEESFILDEEEGLSSSSTSNNSGGTFCGASRQEDWTELEQDNPLPLSSGVTGTAPEGGLPLTAATTIILQENDHRHVPQESICAAANEDEDEVHHHDHVTETSGSRRDQNYTTNGNNNGTTTVVNDSHEQPSLLDGGLNNGLKTKTVITSASPLLSNPFDMQQHLQQKLLAHSPRMFRHPYKPFRRQISLPASIFMSYLLEQNNKTKLCLHQQQQQHIENESNANQNQQQCKETCKELKNQNTLNRSNSYTRRNPNVISCEDINGTVVVQMRLPLHQSPNHKACYHRHQQHQAEQVVQQDSTEDVEDLQNSVSSSAGDYEENYDETRSDKCEKSASQWSSWESKSDTNYTPQELDSGDEQQAFTSEVEKRSLILRHIRRLVRQDTTGNFAPPDFSI